MARHYPKDLVSLDFEETHQRLRRKERKPQGRRSVNALISEDGQDDAAFHDPTLETLHQLGHLEELIGELKSGKEATVYLARGPHGLTAVKLYKELTVRSFKNDAIYREGRFVGDARIEKAIRQRTSTGVDAQQSIWVMHEYAQLWTLWNAGLPVPKPLVGPDLSECAKAGRAVVMEYVGSEDGPALRLSDARLTPHEARSAWEQSLNIIAALLRLGRVHGDYSTYNLLWWEGTVIVIDLPQMVLREESRAFDTLLERDVRSLTQSFSRLGLRESPENALREVRKRARSVPQTSLQLP
ncbi:RIO1 family regulatory kinase/ATPase [Deinococcus peraridilitoris]|uniref:non-specific serine/threonine protein kinase n=1 Tax=Deinococcus peraridilitoris (strain DSM 19664 / LMG 22246 / CIP 109416 / KR-200) TaxID=937777 RepID=L0A1Z0_DEIPD|nr:RIO1 family regulatory kinase/ATPase [Deinococcus peraridilitoris]AFZ67918.1 serine/threonine protein kinase involved in cell cycle control [Deinococcus peraridilitoris DSM 19664]